MLPLLGFLQLSSLIFFVVLDFESGPFASLLVFLLILSVYLYGLLPVDVVACVVAARLWIDCGGFGAVDCPRSLVILVFFELGWCLCLGRNYGVR